MARLLYWWSAAERVLDDLAVGGSGVVPDGPWLEGLTVVFLGLATLAALVVGIALSLWPRRALKATDEGSLARRLHDAAGDGHHSGCHARMSRGCRS
jgi:hypothetical protein